MDDNDTTSHTSSDQNAHPAPADHGPAAADVEAAQKDPAQVAPDQPVSQERVEAAQPAEAPGISHNDSPGGTPEIDGELGPAAPQLHPHVYDHGDKPDDKPST